MPIPPKILVFNDDSIGKILDEFAKLIAQNKLHLLDRKVFKAVGWVGKKRNDDKRTIPSYWRKYNKATYYNKLDYESLSDYLRPSSNEATVKEGVNYYRKSIIRSILKIFRLLDIKDKDSKYFNESSLLIHLEETYPEIYNKFNLSLADWCIRIHNQDIIDSEVKEFIMNDLLINFGVKASSKVDKFLNMPATTSDYSKTNNGSYNTINYKVDEITIDIEVATIHRVKGETHTATLYLETFYRKYDVVRIINYLKAKRVQAKSSDFDALKMAYVGMTRPTHLLCIAIHEENLMGNKEELLAAGWEIIGI